MVGLAATRSVYENWFHVNIYDLNQLVTALIGSAVCPESYTVSLIVIFLFEYTDCICDLYNSKNKLYIYLAKAAEDKLKVKLQKALENKSRPFQGIHLSRDPSILHLDGSILFWMECSLLWTGKKLWRTNT